MPPDRSPPGTAEGLRILVLFGGIVKYGAERGNLEALSALKDQGAKLLLLVSDAPFAGEMRDMLREMGFDIAACPYLVLPRPDYPINPLTKFPPIILKAFWSFRAAVRDFKPTHIHAYNTLYIFNFLPGLALARTPVVYRCGDHLPLHNLIRRLIWRFTRWRVTQFVANCRHLAGELARHGVDADRIRVIYNRPRPSTPAKTSQPRPFADAFSVLYVGQIIESKGPQLVVEAVARLAAEFPAIRLLIAGRITDWEGDHWAQALRDSSLQDERLAGRVEFLGFVEDVPSLVSQVDLTVVPSVGDEGVGGVVLESKQAGTPSIVFPTGGLPEQIEDGVDGFICTDKSVEALVETLGRYLRTPGLARRHGAAAKASLARFNFEDFARLWVAAYLEAGHPANSETGIGS